MFHHFRTFTLLLLALFAGCRGLPEPPASAIPATEATDFTGIAGVRYHVVAERSEFRVRVYRDGPLAALGHNHLLTNREINGVLVIAKARDDSAAELRITVAAFMVDDPTARQQEGQDFAAIVPDAAREATRHNLIGDQVLDAVHFPYIIVRSVGLSGPDSALQCRVEVTIKGQTRTITVPIAIEQQTDHLKVSGQLDMLQSDFGMVPFSVFGGSLRVADRLQVSFQIEAVPAASQSGSRR